MGIFFHALRFCLAILFSVLGAKMAFAVPLDASEIISPQTEITHFAQRDDVGFATRATPLAVPDVAVTGGSTAMHGSVCSLHGHETVAALFGFDEDYIATNKGVSQNQVDDLISKKANGETLPDPSTYMSQADIDSHLAQFDDGAVRFFIPHSSGNIGPRDAFVFPKSAIDDLYQRTGGNIRAVETELGLPQGYFNNAQVAVIDNPRVQMPTGNELGANDQWLPGGYTSGGIPEATLPGTTSVDDVTVITPGDLFNGR